MGKRNTHTAKQSVALDIGFGFTKVCAVVGENTIQFRKPTYLSYWDSKGSEEVRGKVIYDAKEYVFGEDAKFFPSKINIATMDELVNYYPVIIKAVFEELQIKAEDAFIVTGLPPAMHKQYKDKVLDILRAMGVKGHVAAQTTGIFIDTVDSLKSDSVLILDPGYNTFDYLVMQKEDEGDWRRIRSGTLDGQGVNKAVELFKNSIEDTKIKNQPTNALQKAFETGRIIIGGEVEDVSMLKEKAIEKYIEVINGRLKSEIGSDLMTIIEEVVIGGGGANFITPEQLGYTNVYRPEQPEFAQARGYLALAKELALEESE